MAARSSPVAEPAPARVGRRKAFPTRWIVAGPPDSETVTRLQKELRITPPFARILARRGFCSPEEAERFLRPKLDALHDPLALPDIGPACERIEQALRKKERVVLFGDYDVDGISATAILARLFRLIGHPVKALLPERSEGGYGLSPEALGRIRRLQPDLLITLDNGISAGKPLAALRGEGVDSIVVDHHHVPEEGLSAFPAIAVVHPRRPDAPYPFPDLCGAGLAFKLAWALAMRFSHSRKVSPEFRAFLLDALAFAALGTLADVVPLRGENRILAAHGLKALRGTDAPGLQALLSICRIRGAPSASDVSFRLAPRINAAGRCGKAAEALELLTTADPKRAAELAQRLDALNRERQGIEQGILEEARAGAREALARSAAPVALVLDSPDWHPGVIGIVASRLVEEFHRPTVLLALDAEKAQARGSGRSIQGFHLAEAFARSRTHLLDFGGHAAAAGLTLSREAIPAFRAALEAAAAGTLSREDLEPAIRLEERLPLEEVTRPFCEELQGLEPFGAGNPKPVLKAERVTLAGHPKFLGAGERHLSFHARQKDAVLRAVGFGMGGEFNRLCESASAGPLDLAFRPELNTFRGQTSVELHLRAFRAAPPA